jgi:signal transduction histidine kinase
VILAATTAALPLARYLSLPIERLQRASRALAAGALETRVGAPFNRRRDEVGILARAFDTMAERLQALLTDKEMLLRDVSHELRSPLARIRVALALAQRKASEQVQPDLERIETETENLDELVGQVMTLARLRTQKPVNRTPVDLSELIGEIVDDARFEHPDTAISFEPVTVTGLTANASDLRSAIENVVRNALAHAGNRKAVEIEVVESAGRVEIRVRDGGEGVPEADLEKIFEPFHRADHSRDHQHDGQGIGLAITARVVENHGGSVRAENRPTGGLEVVLALPLS